MVVVLEKVKQKANPWNIFLSEIDTKLLKALVNPCVELSCQYKANKQTYIDMAEKKPIIH